LLDHGLTDQIIDKLMGAGVTTVEKLGEMTPEDLETIPEVGPEMVEAIQSAVLSYYGQFEGSQPESSQPEGAHTIEAEKEAEAEVDAEAVLASPQALEGQSVRIEAEQPQESPEA